MEIIARCSYNNKKRTKEATKPISNAYYVRYFQKNMPEMHKILLFSNETGAIRNFTK